MSVNYLTEYLSKFCLHPKHQSSKAKVRKEYQDIGFSKTLSLAKRDVNFRAIFLVFLAINSLSDFHLADQAQIRQID